ncbi:hypothetical protein CVIRNUC_011190 [Coccomyxa viridis]|uniref:Uncharacterized protein n=1 Tax=Coccomyxa viridis TaxID=1274662 RepID=A0AAV1IKV4_9CHLO|nr:hypothetical protein CVIRNUC_011190 [Coccomyxa viridis]
MGLLGSGCAGKARQDWAAANGGEAGIQAIVMQEEARAHLISTKQGSTYPVTRMLRLRPGDIEQVAAFQSMHEEARQENFGYMFRSPSLWEDMVKSITLCNCGPTPVKPNQTLQSQDDYARQGMSKGATGSFA